MKKLEGKVISLKMQNTAVVEVFRTVIHPLYKKRLKRSKKYKVDLNNQKVSLGDVVKIIETKPISKDKYFILQGGILPNEALENEVLKIDKEIKMPKRRRKLKNDTA